MVLTSFVDFEGPIDLFDQDESGQLMGEGQFREANLCQSPFRDCRRKSFGTTDDKAEP